MDYELIDLFNWQEEVKNMISQIEFVRMVSVQSETIERYIRDGKIKADLEVPMGENRSFKYFKEERVKEYAKEFGWDLITPDNIKEKFMDMVETMDMSYSYKPVLLKVMLGYADEKGKVRIDGIIDYFMEYYEYRRKKGYPIEKKNSIYYRGNYTRNSVRNNILSNPFKRFEDMRFMKRCKEIEYVEFNPLIFKKLKEREKEWIISHCDKKLEEYYNRPIFDSWNK